jgi:excisionase family DNA binding protein
VANYFLNPLLSREAVAKHLGCGRRSVDKIIERGELRTILVGQRMIRIPAESLTVYLERRAVQNG